MKIINQQNINKEKIIKELQAGKIIVYPTETCYGIGCRADSSSAVDKLFAIKKRDEDKPVLVLVEDKQAAKKYINWNPRLEKLASTFWPGPLTVVAKVKDSIDLSDKVVSDQTLAIRVSPHKFAQDITKSVDFPLVSTSANISGLDSPYSIAEVKEMYKDKKLQPDILVDSGSLDPTPPSTIVDTVGELEIIREGSIPTKKIFN